MTNALEKLSAAGKALYGSDWQSALARDLSVDARTMRAWLAGSRQVPDAILQRLPGILRQAASDLIAAARDIETVAAALAAENCGK